MQSFFLERASLLVIAGAVFMGALSRWLLIDRHGGCPGLLRSLSAAGTIAIVLYYGLQEIAASPSLRIAIIAGAAFIAEDILLASRSIFEALRSDPAGFLVRIIRAALSKGGKSDD